MKIAGALSIVVALLALACGSSGTSTSTSSSSSSTGGSSSSGGSSSGECADCGGCGIAGPVSDDMILTAEVGTDSAGVAAVGLDLYKAGECRGQSKARSILRFASGTATLAARDASTTIDTTTVTLAGAEYSWKGRDLFMTPSSAAAGGVVLSFREGSTTTEVTCRIVSGAIACS